MKTQKPDTQTANEQGISKLPFFFKKEHLQKFFLGVFLILVLIFIIASWKWLFRPISIRYFLPKEQTVAFLEIRDWQTFESSLLQNFELKNWLSDYLKNNFETEIKPWLGEKVGLAALYEKNHYSYLGALEYKDKEQAVRSIYQTARTLYDDITEEEYHKYTIYSFKNFLPFSLSMVGDFLLISSEKETLYLAIDSYLERIPHLGESEYLQRVKDNLPHDHLSLAYIDSEKFLQNRSELLDILSGYKPLLALFQYGGLTIEEDEHDLYFHSIFYADKKQIPSQKLYINPKKFQAELLGLFQHQGIGSYFGGIDFAQQIQTSLQFLNELNPSFSIIAEGILRGQIKKYFGEIVSLEADILPLLSDEYGVLFRKNETGETMISALLQSKDEEKNKERLQKIFEGFTSFAATLLPETRVITLPDGTEISELIADEKKIEKIEETYEAWSIQGIQIQGFPLGLYFSAKNEVILLASHKEEMYRIIDLYEGKSTDSIKTSEPFQTLNKKLLLDADEISYFHVDFLQTLLPLAEDHILKQWLSDFDSLLIKKKGFDDGASVQGILLRNKAE